MWTNSTLQEVFIASQFHFKCGQKKFYKLCHCVPAQFCSAKCEQCRNYNLTKNFRHHCTSKNYIIALNDVDIADKKA